MPNKANKKLNYFSSMEIAQIKQKLTLNQVLTHYNLTPDRNSRLHCPFHTDKTPSLQLYPKTNTAYCFSTNCPTHGHSLDVIDFILHKEKCNKHSAILKAKSLLGEVPNQKIKSELLRQLLYLMVTMLQ